MKTKKKINNRINSAVIEYSSDVIFITIAYIIFFEFPYFKNLLQPEAREIIYWLAIGYVILGLPYFIIRNYKYPRLYLKSKSKSVLVIEFFMKEIPIIKEIFTSVPREKHFMKITLDEKTRVAILSIVLKFFYIPIMLSFFVANFLDIKRLWLEKPLDFFSFSVFNSWGYQILLSIILFVDTCLFAFSYIFEAKWLRNEIKSVDPYISGWLFAVICYPPFNNSIGMLLKTDSSLNNFFSAPILFFFLLCAIFFYIIYGWATIALWTKSSNLTNRGVVDRGPYRFVRHPAYAAKNIAWWLEQLPYITTWVGFFSIFIWNLIYIMRALTEERHLLADIKYRRYVKKVRWRFIPGVI